uniref:Putative secreted protein n=1 Tax=Anopheles triannulatus TaxID=58253 RepID=A0A2M4B4T4_9DIPT
MSHLPSLLLSLVIRRILRTVLLLLPLPLPFAETRDQELLSVGESCGTQASTTSVEAPFRAKGGCSQRFPRKLGPRQNAYHVSADQDVPNLGRI